MQRFIVTNYAMGRASERVEVVGFIGDAMRAAEKMPARGLPGSGPRAAGKSRVVGIKRVNSC